MNLGFWIFMLTMNLLVPLNMVFFGKLLMHNIPKEINVGFGYRTKMSMKNKDTWQFAHRHCGKLWVRIGLVMLPLTILVMVFLLGKDVDTIGWAGGALTIIQLLVMIVSIFPTQRAIKKTFDNDGNRK